MADFTDAPAPGADRDEYAALCAYADANPDVDYYRFDWSCAHEIKLFSVRENYDFAAVEAVADRVLDTLPAIRRILAKPTLSLRTTEDILPVEAVKVINNRTVNHASVHSELWETVTDDGSLLPRRLMTQLNEDDYAIYENVALTFLILRILSFLRRHIRICRDLLYADRVLSVSAPERTDHLYHYLAVGKIHTGYACGFDRFRGDAERLLNKLSHLYNTLVVRMGSPLIRACRARTQHFTLHKTNLFRMHRDYHAVYLLLQLFTDGTDVSTAADPPDTVSPEGYLLYCTALVLFAAGHFNFACDDGQRIRLREPDVGMSFMDWRLRITRADAGERRAVRMTFTKDTEYTILLIPAADDPDEGAEPDDGTADFRAVCDTDEYVTADPTGFRPGAVFIGITDIESFRRVQQLLLRGMVKSDRSFDVCPFCGHPLTETVDDASGAPTRVCIACRTVIRACRCPVSGLSYMTTGIVGMGARRGLTDSDRADLAHKSAWVYDRTTEGCLHYRNITPVTADGEPLCPICGRVHL